MNKEQILKQVVKVLREREKTHGLAAKNMDDIAIMWTVYLGRNINADDVCAMNILQKLCRKKNNPTNIDNSIDVCGYGAIMGEVM